MSVAPSTTLPQRHELESAQTCGRVFIRHASAADLAAIQPLLESLRALPKLKERSPGACYYRSRVFLHFHAHEGHLFADMRLAAPDFQRLPLTGPAERRGCFRE